MKRMLVLMAAIAFLMPVIAISASAGSGAPDVVINEIFPDPHGSDLHSEFIEIKNRGNEEANISGWYITDQDGPKDFTFPNLSLKAGEIAVVYVGNTSFRWSGGCEFFMNRSTSMLNNGGDDVSLFDSSGNLIDYVAYGNGSMLDAPEEGEWQGAPEAETGLSISRIDGKWVNAMPTPGFSNPETAVKDVVLSAIYSVARHSDEFFALENDGDKKANLSGYMITDGEGYLYLPPKTTLSPGKEMYITHNSTGFLSEMGFMPDMEYSECYTPSSFPQMNNDGDSLSIFSPSGSELSSVSFGAGIKKGHFLEMDNGQWVERRAGWDYRPCLNITFNDTIIPYSSPENSLSVLEHLIDSANYSILLNTYSFDSKELAAHLVSALKRGVKLDILMEGRPVSGMDDREKDVLDIVHGAGADVRIKNGTDRYRYDHAKYMVIDGEWSAIQSENMNEDTLRSDGKNGNRGWGLALKSPEVSEYLTEIFRNDSDMNFSDIEEYSGSSQDPLGLCDSETDYEVLNTECNISVLAGPDNGIQEVINAINSAEKSVYVEQFYISEKWNHGETESPLVSSLLNAAKRGCEVRVLLDGEFYNLNGDDDNDEMAAYFNSISEKEGLNLEARIIDSEMHGLVKVHNKGMIIDGKDVLISSFNWGQNSFTNNRELGALVESTDIADYFTGLFLYDWKNDFTAPEVSIIGPSQVQVNRSALFSSGCWDKSGISNISWYLDGTLLSYNSSVSLNFTSAGYHNLSLNASDEEGNRNSTTIVIGVLNMSAPLDESNESGTKNETEAMRENEANETFSGSGENDVSAEPPKPSEPASEDTNTHKMPSTPAIYYLLLIPALAILLTAAKISAKKS